MNDKDHSLALVKISVGVCAAWICKLTLDDWVKISTIVFTVMQSVLLIPRYCEAVPRWLRNIRKWWRNDRGEVSATNARRFMLTVPLIAGTVLAGALGFTMPQEGGLKTTAYYDGAHVLTICGGHTGDVKEGDVVTEDFCKKLANKDVLATLLFLMKVVKVPLPLSAWIAHEDFAFNVGHTAYLHSTVLAKTNAGALQEGCNHMTDWHFITVAGVKFDCSKPNKRCAGLPVRREREKQQCQKDL